jgi:hypothetical protein
MHDRRYKLHSGVVTLSDGSVLGAGVGARPMDGAVKRAWIYQP